MDKAYSTVGEKRKLFRMLVRKPEGKRPLAERVVGGWIMHIRIGWTRFI
jgi:hypothetical protein